MRRLVMILAGSLMLPALAWAKDGASKKGAGKHAETSPPTHPPLQFADLTKPPADVERLDLFLLMGQSNMKGRGTMPEDPATDPRIVMMHMKDDHWYVARHPLHLVGDPLTFQGADNAGVGPGLAFAEHLVSLNPTTRIGLVPCAVGGTNIDLWRKGGALYENALRRARLALSDSLSMGGRLRGILWLQGEADTSPQELAGYEAKLLQLIDDLRRDLEMPALPFIACTIGEMREEGTGAKKAAMNRLLLSLPARRSMIGCVDARDLKTHIGDFTHFDTAAQNEIGARFAAKFMDLSTAR